MAGVVTTHGSAALDHKPALADGALRRRAQGRRSDLAGQDAGPGVRADGLQRKPDRTAVAQSACAQPQLGRLLRRQRRRGGRRAGALRPRIRRRRFRPHSGRRLRAGGAEARPRAGARRGKLRRSRRAGGVPGRWPAPPRTPPCCSMPWCPGARAHQSRQSAAARRRQLPRTRRAGPAPAADRREPGQPVADDLPLHPGRARRSTPWPTASGCWKRPATRPSEAAIRYDNRYPDAFTTAWTAGVGGARIAPQREALLTPLTRTFRRRAQQRSAGQTQRIPRRSCASSSGTPSPSTPQWDLMLMPALAQTPRPVGWFTGRGPRRRLLAGRRMGGRRRRRLPQAVRVRAVVIHGERVRAARDQHPGALDRRGRRVPGCRWASS